jgi:DNA-binding response OmpR family regulator
MSTSYSLPREGATALSARTAHWPLRLLAIDSAAHLSVERRDGAMSHGIELSPYSDGLAALLGMNQDDPDAILAPTDMKGVGLIPFLDAVVAWGDVPVIVGVGAEPTAAEVATQAIAHGARSLLALPFHPTDLLMTLRNLGFAHHRDRPAQTLAAGPLLLDPQAFRVTLEGVPIPFSVREFQLLQYLMAHADRIVSANELATYSGESAGSTADGVRTSIKRLREKLEKVQPGSGLFVETVIGLGYRANIRS